MPPTSVNELPISLREKEIKVLLCIFVLNIIAIAAELGLLKINDLSFQSVLVYKKAKHSIYLIFKVNPPQINNLAVRYT